jgi:hypothetical protein
MVDQRNFLTRLLGGSGQVARAGQQGNASLLGPRFLSTQAPMAFQRGGFVSPSPVGLLTPEIMSTQAPAGFDYLAPEPQLTKDQEARYSNYLLDSKVRDRLSQKPSALDEIERQPAPAPSLLGRIGGGIRSAGKELGGLFEGEEGQLRARELSKALMTGPTRVPVSFGQSLVEGLSAGGQAIAEADAQRRASALEDMKSALELEKLQLELEEKRGKKNGEGEKRKREKTLSVVSSIDDALEIVDDYGRLAAGVGSLTRFLPETPARRLDLALDSVKANIGFEALQQMRDASKTGGALGQVTERELQFLQRTIAPIEGDLPPEELRRNLMKVRVNMLATAYGVVDAKTGEVRRIESASDYDEILKGNLRVNYEDEAARAEPSDSAVKNYNPETGEIETN